MQSLFFSSPSFCLALGLLHPAFFDCCKSFSPPRLLASSFFLSNAFLSLRDFRAYHITRPSTACLEQFSKFFNKVDIEHNQEVRKRMRGFIAMVVLQRPPLLHLHQPLVTFHSFSTIASILNHGIKLQFLPMVQHCRPDNIDQFIRVLKFSTTNACVPRHTSRTFRARFLIWNVGFSLVRSR